MPRRVIILGSTGSIGTQTLEVIDALNALHARGQFPDLYEVVGLAAGRNVAALGEQSHRYPRAKLAIAHQDVRDLAISEQGTSASFPGRLLQALHGNDAAEQLVREVQCDLVVAAMVGFAGVPATLAAAELEPGPDIALANKETLVAAGKLIVPLIKDPMFQRTILPVDSEHAALWQCLLSGMKPMDWEDNPRLHQYAPPWIEALNLKRAVLTASGGPFRTWTKDQIEKATPEQALNHPTWSMGAKVTIDSASLMNKALEVIEAHWLFGLRADQIDVLVHPQSIVHAMAEFADGSVVAQMAAPDMRTPIHRAMAWPHCVAGISRRIDWRTMSRLDFEPPDLERFPALALARRVIEKGGTSGAILNAANEEAVRAFLDHRIGFGEIARLAARAMEEIPARSIASLADVRDADGAAREWVRGIVAR